MRSSWRRLLSSAAPTARMNLSKGLTAEYRGKTLSEVVAAPVVALEGLGAWNEDLEKRLKLKTVGDLGSWKYFVRARALVDVAALEFEGDRSAESTLNVNKILDAEHEIKSFRDVLALAPSALQGVTGRHDKGLRALNIFTIRDLGDWPAARAAATIVTLAKFETSDVSQHK
mmetsp:Transcript_8565/g.21915  ORF Transcript_8565/g.21915 Transcript_8565/m.21915 type:complete len:172 (+) Transcript_8565:13-528(+)